ncbi:MAG: hypothetical protein QOE61_193 [Micromonosporaceae bacterium]|nr:hypothetical protein [Micromonosporaceae bacterium]
MRHVGRIAGRGLLAILFIGCPALSAPAAADPAAGSIGIKLMDAPKERQDDPRTRQYIVDHLAPGTVIQRRVVVANDSATRRHIEVYAGGATIDGDTFNVSAGAGRNELTSWISVDRPGADVAARSEQRFTVTIAVPPAASAGERYAAIWASTASGTDPTAVNQVHRVGIRIYLDIGPGGEPVCDLEIGDLTTARAANGQPSLTAAIRNTGQRALDVTGRLSLSEGPAGLAAGPFTISAGTTLAIGAAGKVVVTLPRELPNGPWTGELVLTSGRVERTVKARITFPDPAQPALKATKFSVMSLPVVVTAGLVLALAGLAAALLVRRSSAARKARSGRN